MIQQVNLASIFLLNLPVGTTCVFASEEQDKLDEQRKWLDAEVEKVLEQRRQNENLEKVSLIKSSVQFSKYIFFIKNLTLCSRSDYGIVDLFALFRQGNHAIVNFNDFYSAFLCFALLITKLRI